MAADDPPRRHGAHPVRRPAGRVGRPRRHRRGGGEALTTDNHYHAGYQLSGPEALTPAEELRILAEVLGRPLHLVEPSLEETRAGMLGYGIPEPVVDAILHRTLDDKEGTEVLPTVREILGRPPVTFTQWATAHAAQFTRTGASTA